MDAALDNMDKGRRDRLELTTMAIFLSLFLSFQGVVKLTLWGNVALGRYSYRDATFTVKGIALTKPGKGGRLLAAGKVEGRSLWLTDWDEYLEGNRENGALVGKTVPVKLLSAPAAEEAHKDATVLSLKQHRRAGFYAGMWLFLAVVPVGASFWYRRRLQARKP